MDGRAIWILGVALLVGCATGAAPDDGSTDARADAGTSRVDAGSDAASPGDDGGGVGDGGEACGADTVRCGVACVDTATDARNCGACGHDCGALPGVVPEVARCVAGACQLAPSACAPGRAHCTANPDDGCETDVTVSAHCGACGTSCSGATPLCMASGAGGAMTFACTSGCSSGAPTRCGDRCVDLATSPSDCGACNAPCAAGPSATAACVAGACQRACAPGHANCDASWSNGCEVATDADVRNCGGCGVACAAPSFATATCVAGACGFVCDAGSVRCGSACVPNDDPAYGCGDGSCRPCDLAPGAVAMACSAGACVVAACAPGFKDCGGACVRVDDPAYGCGAAACSACRLAIGASAMTCSPGGACVVASCASGRKDCGGACVSTTSTATGCAGASCAACAPAHSAPVCTASGACGHGTCDPGYRDLDGDAANGCETAAPSAVTGLRVWLSVAEPGSIVLNHACGARNCVSQWNNLVDPANPAIQFDATHEPSAANPQPDGTASAVLFGTVGAPSFYYPVDQNYDHTLGINLGSMITSEYTVYVVGARWTDRTNMYAIGCDPGSVFGANTAFHLGWADTATLRLGHYNNDLDLPSSFEMVSSIVRAVQGATGRTLTERRASGYDRTTSDTNTARLTQATSCAIGRGPNGDPGFLGPLFEVLVYNRALTAGEMATVEAYLHARYGF